MWLKTVTSFIFVTAASVVTALDFNATAEKVAGDFKFTEGPVWNAKRGELLFSDIPTNRIYRFKNGKAEVFREPSGNTNGNALDNQSRLVSCEHGNRRVSRTEADGTVVTLANRYDGKRLNSPNDVVVKRDGAIYFTDPPYGVKKELRELDFQGVYRVSPDGKKVTLLVKDFIKPNGLAFSPDEKVLYIADTEGNHIRAFDVAADGTLTHGRVFCQVPRPDGVRVDSDGNLYSTAQTGVEVFSPKGDKLGVIKCPEQPANLAFAGADCQTLYITARTGLYRVRLSK